MKTLYKIVRYIKFTSSKNKHSLTANRMEQKPLAPFDPQHTGISRYQFVQEVAPWSKLDYEHQFQVSVVRNEWYAF